MTARVHEPSFSELYTPKLVTVLKEGYGLDKLRADILAGLTVAIVALPLSMAIAIASGVTPDRGLYTSIVGGFVVSALGGSRFQIGGPAGAFIVLVAAAGQQHGVDGLLLATVAAAVLVWLVCRLKRSVRVSVAFLARYQLLICRPCRSTRSSSSCRRRSPSPCWAVSRACFPPWWPTA